MLELIQQVYEFLLSQASSVYWYLFYASVFIPTAVSVWLIWGSELSNERRIAFCYLLVFFTLPAVAVVFIPPLGRYLRGLGSVPQQTPAFVRDLTLFAKAAPINLALGMNISLWAYLWVAKTHMVLRLIDQRFLLSLAGIALGPLFYLITLPFWGSYWVLLTFGFGLLSVLWADLRAVFFVRIYRWLVSEEEMLLKWYRRWFAKGE